MNLANEKKFIESLEHMKRDCDEATQCLYAYLATHNAMSEHQRIYDVINESSRYWITILSGLQTANFITLGRMFDSNGSHKVMSIIKLAENDISIFDKQSLRKRKASGKEDGLSWLNDYVSNAYEPTLKDFQRMRRYAEKYRSVYNAKCASIRSQVFAHNVVIDRDAVQKLFSKTTYRDIARILAFVEGLYNAMYQLLYNGRSVPLRLGKLNRLPDSIIQQNVNKTSYIGFTVYDSAKKFLNQLKGESS